MTIRTCKLKPCSAKCNEDILHGTTTEGVNGCPVSRGGEQGPRVCISDHPNTTKIKKDTATNNALGAKMQASSKSKSLVTA